MADTKITALSALTAADPANDVLPIVDVNDPFMAASGTTKKISINNILGASGTATLASATITGDLTVDTNTLKVDSANDVVLIGSATKATYGANKLEVRGLNIASPGSTNVGNLSILTTDSQAIDKGGTLALGGGFDTTTPYAFAVIAGRKETSTNANAQGYLQFLTTNSGNSIVERYRIAGDGVATWSNVGGGAGPAMTLNATGLGVGGSPTAKISCAGYSSANQLPDINIARSSSGTAIQTGPNIVFTDGTSNNTVTLQNSQGRFGVWNYGAGSWNERLIVDSSGNVGIGVTPSAWGSGFRYVQAGPGCAYGTNGSVDRTDVAANWYYNGGDKYINATGKASIFQQSGGAFFWLSTNTASGGAGSAMTLNTNMVLDASGNLLVGTNASGGQNGFCVLRPLSASVVATTTETAHNFGALTGTTYATFLYATTVIGSITQNGTTGVLYNTTSDYRLKESVQPIANGLARVNALKPSIYKWKADGSSGEGFIAHELAEVVPAAVSGEKDAVNEDGSMKPQGVDMSRVVPILVAAIQELTARVQTLETR